MTFQPLPALPEVVRVIPDVYTDHRGHFLEAYNAEEFASAGLPTRFVQDNVSRSVDGVIRGLHFQNPGTQGKLVRAVRGAILDVAVDIRLDSDTYGRWDSAVLSEDNREALWIPPGFAHGFSVLSGPADVCYKCTSRYEPHHEHTLSWDDPSVGVDWRVADPVLSEKDLRGLMLPVLEAEGALPRLES